MVKSWWFGLPDVRSVLLTSPVICIATPWLNDKSSICCTNLSIVLVPGIAGSIFINNTSMFPPYRLGGRWWRQFGDETNRCRELVELEVRAQVDDRLVDAGLADDVFDVDAGFAQRIRGFRTLRRAVVEQNVVRDPLVQVVGNVLLGHEAAYLVAHHRLDVVREAGSGHDVGKLARQAGVRSRLRILVDLRLLRRLSAEERRVIGVLAMDQRDEPEIVQFLLAAIRDGHCGRALQYDVAFTRLEVDSGKSFDQSAAFDSANRSGALVQRKGIGDAFR